MWVAVILAAVVPWWDVQNHTHWSKVQWIPFLTPPIKPLDLIGNDPLKTDYDFPDADDMLALNIKEGVLPAAKE